MLVKELVQILQGLNQDMPVLGHDLHDLFVAKELGKEDLRSGYYMYHYSMQRVGRNKKKIPRKIFVCDTSTDTEKYANLDPKMCLFIG